LSFPFDDTGKLLDPSGRPAGVLVLRVVNNVGKILSVVYDICEDILWMTGLDLINLTPAEQSK
jgi:hypothetical protein